MYNLFNMKMTPEHKRKLQEGRKLYQKRRTILVKQKIKRLKEEGIKEIGKFSTRDLFIAGITLYWAEGFKHKDESRLGLATSDPKMAKFYISWLSKCLRITNSQLALRVTANISHSQRIKEIQKFWSDYLNIPLVQFTKPFFQKEKWHKEFTNPQSYHGVIRIHVSKSLDFLRKMRGWLEGLRHKSVHMYNLTTHN